jgi:hypothetical protein
LKASVKGLYVVDQKKLVRRVEKVARARRLLSAPTIPRQRTDADGIGGNEPQTPSHPGPCSAGAVTRNTRNAGRGARRSSILGIVDEGGLRYD